MSGIAKKRQQGSTHWKPGQSGNPKGRPKGTLDVRNFRERILKLWDEVDGDAKMRALADKNFPTFCKLVFSLMPKEIKAQFSGSVTSVTELALRLGVNGDRRAVSFVEGVVQDALEHGTTDRGFIRPEVILRRLGEDSVISPDSRRDEAEAASFQDKVKYNDET